jgi:hypothetical protein
MAHSWADIRNAINQSSGANITIWLAPDFICNYSVPHITIIGKNVTIRGFGGALLDANKKGRFFAVESGAHLALDSLALRNGYYNGNDLGGGAVYILEGGIATISDTTFTLNSGTAGF